MELSIETFDKICRVCLIQSTELKSLFTKLDGDDRSLCDILAFAANIHVKFEDSLPKQVCSECESTMCKADAFKQRCHESESILNTIYQNADGYGDCTSVGQDRPIKAEKTDIKQKLSEYGTLVSPVASNSAYKHVFDKKNIPIQDFSLPSTASVHFNKFPDLKDHEQPVKKESVNNFDDENDFMDHFDDGIQIEIVPVEHTPKVEKKVKKENNKQTRPKKSFAIRYECYCHKQFTNKVAYNAHLKEKQCDAFTMFGKGCSSVVNGKLQCTKCDKSFNSSTALKVHIRTHRKDLEDDESTELFQCSLCLRKFKNKMSLAAHIQRHEEMDGIKHVCQICKREFKYKAYLENHLLTVHSKTFGLTCEICTESFTSKEDLEEHKKTHDNDKKHSCTICNKSFFMLCTLKEHIRTHTGEKPFLCSQCGKGFSQKTNLAQHTRRHQGLKPFKCDSCEKRFVSKGELDAHTRKHSGAHPFRCDDCGNGFTTSSALVKHRRTHTGERPYLCDLCPMRFAASGTLKNHRRTHTGERPFQCSYCEKAFVQRNDLISHIRCHTGERPYVCNQCGQAFRKASGLKSHVKMHIKDPIVGVNALLTRLHCTNEQ